MYKGLRKTKSGQISVEASIIVPIAMVVIASLIYMAFYAHDIISIRCGAYALSIEEENNKGQIPSLFVIEPKLVKAEEISWTKVKVRMTGKGNTNFINSITNGKNDELLIIQKTMNPEILYAARALQDIKKEGEN